MDTIAVRFHLSVMRTMFYVGPVPWNKWVSKWECFDQVFCTILQFSFIHLQNFLSLIQFIVIYPGYPGYGQDSWDMLVLGQKQSTVELHWSCLYSRARFSIKLLDNNIYARTRMQKQHLILSEVYEYFRSYVSICKAIFLPQWKHAVDFSVLAAVSVSVNKVKF